MAKRWHVAALVMYAAESWLFLDHGASLTRNVLGSSADPSLIMWFLAWWPWAVTHHVHSLHSFLVWQPAGLNLAWTTCVPLLALLGLPFTLAGGPILAFNMLTLAAPVLAAYGAFLLCLALFEVPAAALIGGWLFGFSSYESAQSFDHLNLDFTVLVPLAVLVALSRLRGRLRRGGTVLALGVLLGGEFLISDEILATGALFSAAAFGLGYAMLPAARGALRALVVDVALAAPLAMLLCAPLLWAMLTGPYDVAHPAFWARWFITDLGNFILPTPASAFFGADRHFPGGYDEQDGYLGLPAILLLALAWREQRGNAAWRLGFCVLAMLLVASLGPELYLFGHHTHIPLPWALLLHLPLLGAALPARCMLFASLLVAMISAAWVAAAPARLRVLLGALACAAVLPVPHPVAASPDSAFFRPGVLQAALGANPRVMILPFGIAGLCSYWQAENGFGFTQVGGYLGYPPIGMQKYPAVLQLFSDTFLPGFTPEFAGFARATGTQYVIAAPGTPAGEWAALRALDWPAQKIDDVTVFTVPPK